MDPKSGAESDFKAPTRTLLRVKRRRSEVAWPGIALESDAPAKRAKCDFALLARQNSAEVAAPPPLTPQNKAAVEKNLQRKGAGLSASDLRQQIRQNRGERERRHRLKVVTASREASAFKIIDLEPENEPKSDSNEAVTCNGEALIREKNSQDEDFVYDIYEINGEDGESSPDIDDAFFEHMASIQAFGLDAHDLMADYRDQDDDLLADSEDSNDEGNWRNDYPDEEEYAELAYDSDLSVGRLNLGEGSDSEGSDDESALVYSRQMKEDEDLHGASYARFKQRVLKDLHDSDSDSDEVDINEVDEY